MCSAHVQIGATYKDESIVCIVKTRITYSTYCIVHTALTLHNGKTCKIMQICFKDLPDILSILSEMHGQQAAQCKRMQQSVSGRITVLRMRTLQSLWLELGDIRTSSTQRRATASAVSQGGDAEISKPPHCQQAPSALQILWCTTLIPWSGLSKFHAGNSAGEATRPQPELVMNG